MTGIKNGEITENFQVFRQKNQGSSHLCRQFSFNKIKPTGKKKKKIRPHKCNRRIQYCIFQKLLVNSG
jgi:hypothetical protein